MKFTTKLFLTWSAIFLIFYLFSIFVIGLLWMFKFKFWQLVLVFIISGVLPPALLTMLFYKRLDFMESEDIEAPTFSGAIADVIDYIPRGSRVYDEVLQRVDKGFIISYSDRESGVIKFRTDSRVLAWGLCGYLKIKENNQVEAVVYPMNPKSKKERKLMLQTVRLLNAILKV